MAVQSDRHAPVVVLDRENRVVRSNAASEALAGLSASGMRGRTFAEVFPGCNGEPARLEPGESVVSEVAAGGVNRFVRWEVVDVPSPDGGFLCRVLTGAVSEPALWSRPEDFRRMFENHAAMMYVADHRTLRLLEANKAMAAFYGYSREELTRLRIPDLNVRSEQEIRRFVDDAARAGGARFRGQHRLANGAIRDVEISSTAIQLDSGIVFFGVMQDITESLRAEEGLKEAKARLSEAQRLAKLGNWSYDPAPDAFSWSDQMFETYGIQPYVSVTLDRFLDAIHPDDRKRTRAVFSSAPTAAVPLSLEHRAVLPGGEVRHVFVLARRTGRAETGWQLEGTAQDITARKQIEEALRRSEENLRRAFLNAPYPIAIHADGEMLLVNKSWTEATGYSAAEIPTVQEWCRLAYRERSEAMNERVRRVYDMNREVNEGEFVIVTKSGEERIWRFSAASLGQLADGRRAAITLAVDLTEYKRLEAELRQAQKMEAVGKLAGGVAHDFNNLLTVIGGYSKMLLETMAARDPLRAPVEAIESAAERAASLTSQLLAFSRKQVLQPRVTDLSRVLEDTQKMLRRLIPENVELAALPAHGLWKVLVDPGQIVQVILNLAVNARDAMPGGGRLSITTANVHVDEAGPAGVHGVPKGDYVQLSVADTGIGMDRETQARVFEPFFTTKEVGKGTGLGLSTVYGILKQSGGHVTLESAPGHGATFRVFLPRIAEAATAGGAARKEARPRRESGTILLVEDDVPLRTLIRGILANTGYQVLEAESPHRAVEIGRQHAGDIDLMITDVVMPEMGGPAVAKVLRTKRPSLKVLYMSGYADANQRGEDGEALEFLEKPFHPRVLTTRVREILARA